MNHRPTQARFVNARSIWGVVSHQFEKGQALAQTIRVIRGFKLAVLAFVFLLSGSVMAAIGSSPEFRLDLRGLGPWQRHVARGSESLAYSSTWATNAAAVAKAVVKVMPVLKTKPKYLVIDLSGGTSATHYPISSLDEVPGGSWSDEYKTSKLVLRHIPAGSFIMGGRASDFPGAVNTNLHMVTITRDFYMGVFEVTQRQWELVMGTRPSAFTNETCYATRPVETVSYEQIRGSGVGVTWPDSCATDEGSFMEVLRRKAHCASIDLPTEAQWEFACRASTPSALYSGENLSDRTNSVEVSRLARFAYNSGWSEQDVLDIANGAKWTEFNCSAARGSAAVGSYSSNSIGLYDMIGNAIEMCLDVFDHQLCGSVDPVGRENGFIASGRAYTARPTRGGSWRHPGWVCTAATRDYCWNHSKMYQLGFRLCLQCGDVPDFAAASTLVNESGTGSQSWSPTKAGTYYLTHSTMNGATNAQLYSAWFEVPGCELTLEPQGELTNGVSVAIGGAGEGWTVYYTTDGSAPTRSSSQYTGAFSLPSSGTVRAVAYNAQGVSSEEAMETFTLHDALGVVGAVARPRYPWNGMVDVDCELKGDSGRKYVVELVAKDLDGGTNLAVKTVGARVPACPHVNVEANGMCWECGHAGRVTLPAGRHRLTWNAGADIVADGEFPRVAVTVKATAPSVLDDYARQFEISIDGYAGTETLTNVPVLVRLSKAIEGFDYGDFANPSNGADLAFFDANEKRLPYEIDEWHTNGESLVWVKLPEVRKGTRFTCAFGNSQHLNNSTSQLSLKHEVWREYAGVWHMNEDSGTAFDSTEHGLDALPSSDANGLADIGQMVAYENGACGRARVNATNYLPVATYMMVPSYDAMRIGGRFTISGWFWYDDTVVRRNSRLFRRKEGSFTAPNGWEVELNLTRFANARGASGETVYFMPTEVVMQKWAYLTFVYDTEQLNCYTNGVFATPWLKSPSADLTYASSKIATATDNGMYLSFGDAGFNGQYDEIRLRGGSLSADRIKADYDMITNRAFLRYETVRKMMRGDD